MTTAATTAPASVPLRQDAPVIGLVGLAHMVSHFSQLTLPPLFPWLKDAMGVGYVQLGALMTIFFVVSCAMQAMSGFLVDKHGPRPVLFAGLGILGLAIFGFAASTSYWMLAAWAVVAGIGNGVFHPVDYTLINRKVSGKRLGHAYSVHGITGSLGWALGPAVVVPVAIATNWRTALAVAGALAFGVLVVLWFNRRQLDMPRAAAPSPGKQAAGGDDTFAFLGVPAVWMCFLFFLAFGGVLSAVQAFAPEAARQLHGVPMALAAACLTIYMVCSATGMVFGGFMASDPAKSERVVAAGFGTAAVFALSVAMLDMPPLVVPVIFGVMGFASGLAGPSRDLIVKKSAPENASGRVYGIVYSGLDIGQAIAPLLFGWLVDHRMYAGVWLGLMAYQLLMVAGAFKVRRSRRTVLAPA